MPYYPPSSSGAAAAGTLTGTTLASNVVTSSLTSVGTLTALSVSGRITCKVGSSNTDVSVGNAAYGLCLNNGDGNWYFVYNSTAIASAGVNNSGINGFKLPSGGTYGFAANLSSNTDASWGRNATGVIEANDGATAGTFAAVVAKEFRFAAPTSANGQYLAVKSLTELLTIAAAVTSTTTIQKPANSIILGVSVRNTVAVTCTSTYTVGDSTSATRFSTVAVSKAVNTTNDGTKAGAYYNATAEGIIITPDTTPSDATGRVRVTIHYLAMTAPTS